VSKSFISFQKKLPEDEQVIEVIQLTNRTIIKPSVLIYLKKKHLKSGAVHSRNLVAEF